MNRDLKYLALTIYGEARGEPIEGQIAVASVIRNRIIKNLQTWPAKEGQFVDICLTDKQFSCWNKSDPNYTELNTLVIEMERADFIPNYILKQCLFLAKGIISGELHSNIKGATHYLETNLYERLKHTDPNHWANKLAFITTKGHHTFLD